MSVTYSTTTGVTCTTGYKHVFDVPTGAKVYVEEDSPIVIFEDGGEQVRMSLKDLRAVFNLMHDVLGYGWGT